MSWYIEQAFVFQGNAFNISQYKNTLEGQRNIHQQIPLYLEHVEPKNNVFKNVVSNGQNNQFKAKFNAAVESYGKVGGAK